MASTKAENAIDNLFTAILAGDAQKTEHLQARIEFIAEKADKNPQLLGYKIYKLHVAQAYLLYQQDILDKAYEHLEAAENLLDGHEMQAAYNRAQEKIISYIQQHLQQVSQQARIDEIRKNSLSNFLSGIGCLTVGGIVTGITYSLASPGSTYLVTSGLFLVGGFNILRSIYYFLKWLGAKATA